jgi:hypothetical protein
MDLRLRSGKRRNALFLLPIHGRQWLFAADTPYSTDG